MVPTPPSPSFREAALLSAPENAASHGPRDGSSPADTAIAPVLIAPVSGDTDSQKPVSDPHLRHLIIGSPAEVQDAIHRLHVLRYVERHLWTPPIEIGEQGIRITPRLGQVLSYLVLQRPNR